MEFLKDIDDFITEKKNMGWSATQLCRAKLRLAVFVEDLSNIHKITNETLENWKKILEERGLSERTISEYMVIANQFLEFAGHSSAGKKCGRTLNLQGKTFGKLTVLEPCADKRSKERSIIWKCQCSCGKIVEIPANQLTKGLYTSCGCERAERLKETNQYIDGTSLKMVFSNTVRKDNSSGYKGVYWKDDRWAVRIQYKEKRYFLGSYDKLEDAVSVRKEAEEKIREEARSVYG